MILIIHILVAILGIAMATFAYIYSSQKSLIASKLLAVLTFSSGTFLVIQTPSAIVKSCLLGILYLGIVLILNYKTSYKISNH